MSREESLATLIQETLREALERHAGDPAAVDRVEVAVGAALGPAPEEADPSQRTARDDPAPEGQPSDRQGGSRRAGA